MQDLRFDELEFHTAQQALAWMDANMQNELANLQVDYSNCGFIFHYLEEQTRLNNDGFPYMESIKLNIYSIAALLMQWEPGLPRWSRLVELLSKHEVVKAHLEKFLFGFASVDTYGNTDFSLDLYEIDQFQIPIHQSSLEGQENILYLLGLLYDNDYQSANWKAELLCGDRKEPKHSYLQYLNYFINLLLNRYYDLLTAKICYSWTEYASRKKEILSFSHCYALAESHIYRVDENGEIIDFFPIKELTIHVTA